MSELLKKYDIPAPRYTSYPTVPYWDQSPTTEQWLQHIKQTIQIKNSSWALYIHMPFCETLCTFCGCNTSITKDHSKEAPYIKVLLKELDLYLTQIPELTAMPLKQIHLGGGSPTFFSPNSLDELLSGIFSKVTKAEHDFEGAIEVDPRRTQKEQLEVLKKWGFNRISLGVQDFHPEVQRLVNRIQPFSMTEKVTVDARSLGFDSVNFDLIYGLAKQTPESIEDTTLKTIQLRPDRIALYSLAIVPWIKPQQKLFKDEDLPKGEEKRKLYEIARDLLLKNGYVEIGMDHFALKKDALYKKSQNKELHRNFMGYTDQKTDLLLGLGVSAISETPFSFHQNEKVLNVYEQKINKDQLPTLRGHVLSDEDKIQRLKILKFMTEYEVDLDQEEELEAKEFLKEMFKDELLTIKEHRLILLEKGKPFLRNAAMFFDKRLKKSTPLTRVFSQSI